MTHAPFPWPDSKLARISCYHTPSNNRCFLFRNDPSIYPAHLPSTLSLCARVHVKKRKKEKITIMDPYQKKKKTIATGRQPIYCCGNNNGWSLSIPVAGSQREICCRMRRSIFKRNSCVGKPLDKFNGAGRKWVTGSTDVSTSDLSD